MSGIVTVTAAAATSQLTTLTNAKGDLGVTGSADDSFIGRLIDRASGLIARHCGRTLGLETVAEVFRHGYTGPGSVYPLVAPYGTPIGQRAAPVVLSRRPVVAVSGVTDSAGATVDPTYYELDPAAGLLWRLSGTNRIPWAFSLLTVTYQAGWKLPNDAAANMPADLEDACLSLVRQAYFSRGSDPSIAMELQEGVGRVNYQPGASPATMAIDDSLAAQLAPFVTREW